MRIRCQLLCVCIHLLLLKTDGLSDENITITGPESFITDGSRSLTLTCLATDADPETIYSWAPSTIKCVIFNTTSGNCTLTPSLDQDNTTIFCTAVSSQGPPSQARYTFNLTYPPETPPNITSSTQDHFLSFGDTVTCTVKGGKPLVTAVHINCTNQYLTSTDNTTIGTSSSVTISTSQTAYNTTCYCWATWEPEPGLYTLTSQESFMIGEKPQINSFTINEQAGNETVTEGNTNVTFICEARGRPTPTIYISFGSPQVPRGGELWDDNTTSGLSYTIPTVTCDDGGLYTCTADNGFREPASKSVQLTVNSCGRRLWFWPVIGVSAGVGIIGIAAVLVWCCCCKRRGKRREKSDDVDGGRQLQPSAYALDNAGRDIPRDDPGYASTDDVSSNPALLNGQGSPTDPTSALDASGYACPYDTKQAAGSNSAAKSRTRSGRRAPEAYAVVAVADDNVNVLDEETRQSPNEDGYDIVGERPMGDNPAGVSIRRLSARRKLLKNYWQTSGGGNRSAKRQRRNNIPLGEDNYDHFSHQVRQTPAKADPQYSHLASGGGNRSAKRQRRNNIPLGEDNYDHFSHQVRQTPAKADPQYSHLGGLSDDSIHIMGPESFITDGTRNLTLTCFATDADPGTVFTWSPPTFRCINYTQNSRACMIKPRLDQDNTTIVCTAISGSATSTSQASFTLNLKYPPQTPPAITSSTKSHIVFVGDTVACTVQGGKPLVTAIHINCSHLQLTSTGNNTVGESVSSSVTISTLQTTNDNTTCYCWATWEPEPGLYTVTSQESFQIRRDTGTVNKSARENDWVNPLQFLPAGDSNPSLSLSLLPDPTLTTYQKLQKLELLSLSSVLQTQCSL